MHQPFPETMAELLAQFPYQGRVDWLGVRPARRTAVQPVETVTIASHGLEGDHRARPGKRAVTLIQAEHLPAIAALLRKDRVDPAPLRRNIVVSGINLIALKQRTFKIGGAVLCATGPCAPCSRMEQTLGPGGYNAMRGHGGITAEVIEPGIVSLGDQIIAL